MPYLGGIYTRSHLPTKAIQLAHLSQVSKAAGHEDKHCSVVVGPLPKRASNSSLEARQCMGQYDLVTTFRNQSQGHICSHIDSDQPIKETGKISTL